MKCLRLLALVAAGTCGPVAMAAQAPAPPTPQALEAFAASTPTAVAHYGVGSRAIGELRVPRGKGPFPVAMLIHGGCYQKGSATQKNLSGLASQLQQSGVASWTIDYRELGDEGAGWPGTFQDWLDATAELSELAKSYPLDLSRATVVGHSAGVTPAIWLAARPLQAAGLSAREPLVRFQAAALIDGPLDLAQAIGLDRKVCGRPVVVPFLGGGPTQVPYRYNSTSLTANWPAGVRILLIPGELLPLKVAHQVARQAPAGTVTVQTTPNGTHLGAVYPGDPDFEAMYRALVKLAKEPARQ